MARYLDPKNDLIFKKIFGHHPELLKSFLNAILPLPEDCIIESLTYLPTESVPDIEGLKHPIVDVRCLDNNGRYFIVEMQLQWSKHFIQRMLFNTASAYVRQLNEGVHYKHLSPVYGLALIDDTFSEEEDWYHHFRMSDIKNKKLEDIQLVLIELPKFKPTTIADKRLAILWIRFFKEINARTDKVDQALLEEEPIKQALELLHTSAYSQEELLAYDRNWDAIRTGKTLMEDKYDQGKEEGEAKGKAEGLAEGEAKGLAKGKTEAVLNMHRLGLPINQISEVVQLSPNQIEIILADQKK